MKIDYTTFSEAGTRPYNEDYIRVVEMPEQYRTLFVLCDGMGGHAMGDLASHTVGDVFANYWLKTARRRYTKYATKHLSPLTARASTWGTCRWVLPW